MKTKEQKGKETRRLDISETLARPLSGSVTHTKDVEEYSSV